MLSEPPILSGAHNHIVPRLMQLLKEKELDDVLVVIGGIIPDEDLLDQQPYNLLAIMDVDGLRRRPEPAEKRGERFGETKRGGAVIRLVGDRLQLAADGALALAQRRAALT